MSSPGALTVVAVPGLPEFTSGDDVAALVAPALRTLIYFDQADITAAIASGVSTVLVIVAMVAGLSAARMLTDPEWTFTRFATGRDH